mgnify:CR=1 FL=1
MNKEEQILKRRFGNKNHFTVPEGYFQQFNTRLMGQLPEREARVISVSPWKRLRPTLLAAACISGILLSAGIYRHATVQEQKADLMAQTEGQNYYDIDEAADYLMLDNDDIYAMLTN